MIVQSDNNPTSYWKPVTVKVTLETKEEYKLLFEMLGYDITIPEIIHSVDEKKLSSIMRLIQEGLYEASKEAGNY